ncbi:uncharacterized protein LOC116971575 [Amblyraja radiata]|uniref:uncharacterized protein LOC116971575 n=1 Tax=Amblyraja radiata TaxID=386614 RepID=UPI0014042162|nr:uncharacterized protein LOC116971575 [Amblyraja radiata]
MVIGMKGATATLPCSFSPSNRNPSSITINWLMGNPPKWSVVFRDTSPRPAANHIPENVNRGNRYELVGNLTQGDASIRVNGLKLNDTSDYSCHVYVRNSTLTTVTQDEMKLQVVGDNDRASMVIGRKGATATLPCSFSPSNRNPSSITISWIKGNPPKWSVVFRDTSPRPAANHIPENVNKGNRYELVGNLTQGDASIRVKGLKLDDASDYSCHVYVRNSMLTVTQDEMKLQVVVPATILELFVVSDNVTGEPTLVCRAEGKPPANITWIVPGNSSLPVNISEMIVTHDPEKLLTVGELLHPRLPGKYTCVAVNEHQIDTREIRLFGDGLRVKLQETARSLGSTQPVAFEAQREKRMLFILLCAFALPVTADRCSNNGWTMETPDMVMGREGKLVVLYCKFIHPHHQYKGNINIIWKEEGTKEPIFKYKNYLLSGKYKNEIVNNVGDRYRPMGDPRKNDASIIINQLRATDTNKILNCRVELTEQARAKFGCPHGRITASGEELLCCKQTICLPSCFL